MKIKSILVCFFICAVFAASSYDSVITWDNSVSNGDGITFDGKSFIGKDFKRDFKDVSRVLFNQTPSGAAVQNGSAPADTGLLIKRGNEIRNLYPGEKIYILLDKGYYKTFKENKRYYRARYSVLVNSRSELGAANLSFYNKKGEYESNLLYARSVSPDGKVSYLNQSSVSESSYSQGMQFFRDGKDEKILKYTVPDVDVGSIIDYEYETTEYNVEDPNQFFPKWFFGGEHSSYESVVEVAVPDAMDFYYSLENVKKSDIKVSERREGGFKIYKFEHSMVKSIVPEPNSVPEQSLYPYVEGSTFKDQTYLSAWLSKFFKERIGTDDAMKKAVDTILTGTAGKEERIALLYRYMQENVKYLSIKMSVSSGMAGHKAAETFANKYGDCIDKAILFASLLNYAGVEAYPVIVMTNDKPKPLYGKLGVLSGNHAINEIHLDGRVFYLDSTSTTYRYPYWRSDDHGVFAWNPLLNKVSLIPYPDPEKVYQEYSYLIRLDPSGSAVVTENAVFRAHFDAGYRDMFMSANDRERGAFFARNARSYYPISMLAEYKIGDLNDYKNDFFMNSTYKSAGVGDIQGNYMIISVPERYDLNFASLRERETPQFFETTFGKRNEVVIEIPAGYALAGAPDPISIDSPFIKFTGEYTLKDNRIIYHSAYYRKKAVIMPAEYGEFRELMLKIAHFIKNPVVLEKR